MALFISLELGEDLTAARKLVNMVLLLSANDQASEVYFEPREEHLWLAYRVGGEWQEMVPAPSRVAGQIVSTLKSMAGIDRVAQQTQSETPIELSIDTRLVPATVRFRPTEFGEAATVCLSPTPDDAEDARRLLKAYDSELRNRHR